MLKFEMYLKNILFRCKINCGPPDAPGQAIVLELTFFTTHPNRCGKDSQKVTDKIIEYIRG